MSLDPPAVASAVPAAVTVALSGPAPAGGLTIPITTDTVSPHPGVPASVTVPEGAATATFPVAVGGPLWETALRLSAKLGLTRQATLQILPAISQFSVQPVTLLGGNTATGTISLHAAAGFPIQLSTDNPQVVVVPERVFSGAQSGKATFTVTTRAVRTVTDVTVQANLGGAVRSVDLRILPATLPALPAAPPGGLTGDASSGREIRLQWIDGSSDETAFAIWRKTATTGWTRIGVVPPNMTVFADRDLVPYTAYTYRVRATNDSTASAWTREVTVAMPPPAVPVHLSAFSASPTQIDLQWIRVGTNATGYGIWRKTLTGWERVGVTPAGTTRFSDRNLNPGATHTYRVRAHNGGGASPWSNEATARLVPPITPRNLRRMVTSGFGVTLGWEDWSGNETAFAIWRKSEAGDWTRIGLTRPNQTGFTDTKVTAGARYTYRIRATNNVGASAWSNEITVTTSSGGTSR